MTFFCDIGMGEGDTKSPETKRISQKTLEAVVKEAIDIAIQRCRTINEKADAQHAIADFAGFWKYTSLIAYTNFTADFEKFQKNMIRYHHEQTQDLEGNARYASELQFALGDGLKIEDYNRIINTTD